MEIIVVFIVTLVVLVGLALALAFGRPPTYRPGRKETLQLIREVIAGEASEEAWQLFLSLPILHDPVLETFREQCLEIDEGTEDKAPCGAGLNGYIYGQEGRERLGLLADELDAVIAKEPVVKEF
ncbi:hypothetical protein [Marinobacterium jannaschii]|uniref:hypothetical protein n=1 Tax=Marinobacterium jannaschii TaxID=64970 RepID=UPI000483C2DC|nr:hypothetical protein [Marinobacterium jannaschii]